MEFFSAQFWDPYCFLILIYVNHMHLSMGCKLALYADDSALIFSHSDANVIADRLSKELQQQGVAD